MRDERDVAAAGRERHRGVRDVEHERAAADGRAVDERRLELEVLRDLRRRAGGEDGVDFRLCRCPRRPAP